MPSLLATDSIAPACRVLPPNAFADVEGALAYWLSNPLLPAGKVAATQALLDSRYYTKGDKQALVLRLKKRVETLRQTTGKDYAAYALLLDLIKHELIDPAERNDLKPCLNQLRGAEIEREYTRLEQVLKHRMELAYPHAA